MDISINSFARQRITPPPTSSYEENGGFEYSINEEEEESGWTVYIDDFLSNGTDNSCCSSDFGTPSMVSDAASCPAWKFMANNDHKVLKNGHSSEVRLEKVCKDLSFKKRKITTVLVDDESLEDTASSPVNSPKVSDLKHVDMNSRKNCANMDIPQKKRNSGGDHVLDLQRDDSNKKGCSSEMRFEEQFKELKKRGLCLVPLSMLMNYLG